MHNHYISNNTQSMLHFTSQDNTTIHNTASLPRHTTRNTFTYSYIRIQKEGNPRPTTTNHKQDKAT
jgi:hypothetical protein